MNRALILGVSGQDGAYLAKFLFKKGYEVIGASRDAETSLFNNLKTLGINNDVKKISVNANEFRTIFSALKKYAPSEIYNLAGQSSVGLSFEQPIETFESIAVSNLNILEAVRMYDSNIKIYNAGSSECFGNTTMPANEETAFAPRSPYAIAKATSIWQIRNYRESYNLFAANGILFNHESSLRASRFVTSKIIDSALEIKNGKLEKLKLGNLDVERDWGYAGDYVEAMWLMLQQQKPSDYIIATGETNSLKDFVKVAFEMLGMNWKDYVETTDLLLRPSDIGSSKANPAKAQAELGWIAKNKMKDVINMMLNKTI